MQSLIILATKNAGKVREIQALLSAHAVKVQSLLDFGPLPGAVEDGHLIVTCGGLGTANSVWAGIMLIIFHAVTKSLL